MKKIILSLGLSLLAQTAIAQDTLVGACLVTNGAEQKTYTFSAGPDEKYRLGIADEEHGPYFQVSVVNNIGNDYSAESWGHTVLISISPLQREFANPPVLCDSRPEYAADCHLKNEMEGSYGTRFTHFAPRYNTGYADTYEAQYFPLKELVDGTPLITPVVKLGKNTTVLCQAAFVK